MRAPQADLLARGEHQLAVHGRPALAQPAGQLEQDRDSRLVVGAEDRVPAVAVEAVLQLDLDPVGDRDGVEVCAQHHAARARRAGNAREQVARTPRRSPRPCRPRRRRGPRRRSSRADVLGDVTLAAARARDLAQPHERLAQAVDPERPGSRLSGRHQLPRSARSRVAGALGADLVRLLGALAGSSAALPRPLERGGHELPEHRLGAVRARLELGVVLRGHEEGVVGQLDHLDEAVVGRGPAEHQAVVLEAPAQQVVDLVAVPVALVDHGLVVRRAGASRRRGASRGRRRGASCRPCRRPPSAPAAGRSPGTASRDRTRRSWRPPGRRRGGRSRPPRAACRGRCRGTGSCARARRAQR